MKNIKKVDFNWWNISNIFLRYIERDGRLSYLQY